MKFIGIAIFILLPYAVLSKLCPSNMEECNIGGSCIPLRWVCDGEKDCPDGEDEQDCAQVEPWVKNTQYKPVNHWPQAAKQADPWPKLSTGPAVDPWPQAVEPLLQCPDRHFLCDQTCIPNSFICNGARDCNDVDDEANCGWIPQTTTQKTHWDKPVNHWPQVTTPAEPWHRPTTRPAEDPWPQAVEPVLQCPARHFLCDEACIPNSFICNGARDCNDVDDESNCAVIPPQTESPVEVITCADGEVQCFDGSCIDNSYMCNGRSDCKTGEDEFACEFKNDREFSFRCISKCLDLPKNCSSTQTKPAVRPPTPFCDQGYVQVHDKCIDVNVDPLYSWEEARLSCIQQGAQLVEIDTGNFFLELQRHLNISAYESYSFWTGGRYNYYSKTWIWQHSETRMHEGTPLWAIEKVGNSYKQRPFESNTKQCGLLQDCPFQYLTEENCQKKFSHICQKPFSFREW